MKRGASLKIRLLAFFTVTLTLFSIQPANAATLFTTDNTTGSSYGFSAARRSDTSFTIPSATTIQSIRLKVANTVNYPANVATISVYSGTSSAPVTLLGNLSFSSFSDPYVTLTGNINMNAAGTYWLRFGATAYYQPQYSFTVNTTGSLPGWSVGRMRESADSGATFTSRSDDLVFLFTIFGTGGGLISASTIAMNAPITATYRVASSITATMGEAGSDGKVTFYANKKKIQGCISLPSSSLSATCSWKPATRGAIALSAKVIPNDSNVTASSSTPIQVKVNNRTTRR